MKRKNLKDMQGSGFKVPKDYFEKFEDLILSHTNLKEKVSDSGFSIPQDYFDIVEETIFSKVSQNDSSKVISLINKKAVLYVASMAAALILMFNLLDRKSGIDINSIETASIERFLNDEDFGSDDLAALFEDTEFLDDSFNSISFSEEAMEDYVIDNLELDDLYIE